MKVVFLIVSISCLLLACAGKPINTGHLLTLEYYPECDYQVLGMVRGVDGYTSYEYVEEKLSGTSPVVYRKPQGNRQNALYQLKKNALEKGADAIAITHFTNLKSTEVASNGGKFKLNKYIYEAQAIKLCSTPPKTAYNTANSKPVRFDEAGNLQLGSLTFGFKLKPLFSELNDIEKVETPELTNHTISSMGDVFGLSLGMSKSQLLAALGAPSATIIESNNKHIIQYGRRHLFYLVNDEFVAYEYSSWFLPPHINNKVLFHNQFDKLKWILDKEITLGHTLEKVKEVYGNKLIKKSSEYFMIENKGVDVNFTFHKDKNHYTDKVLFKLANVVVSKKNISFKTWDEIIASNTFNRSVDIASTTLPIMPYDSKRQVKLKLGEPKAIIKNNKGKLTWVYDNELHINFYSENVFNYSFEKSSFNQQMDECESCLYLGQKKKSIPVIYIKKSTDFEFLLENNGVVYSLIFSNIDGVSRVEKIEITTKA